MAARAWALVNHNLTVTVQVLKSSDAITYTAVDSANVSGVDPFFRTFTADTARYWRIRLPAGAVEAKAGELLLGVPLTLSRSPKYGGVVDGVVPNVQRDESPGGYAWRVRRGAKRSRLVYTFDTLPDADWALVKQALDETDDGAKSFLVQDIDGVLRWVEWMLPAQGASAVLASLGRHQTTIELLEAL